MNKFKRDVVKMLKKLNTKVAANYTDIFNDFRELGVYAITDSEWNKPSDSDFQNFGADAELYMQNIHENYIVTTVNVKNLIEVLDYFDEYVYVTADELKKFETITYPSLYAKWLTERNRMRSMDARKLRAQIAKLQKELKELEG